MQFSTLATIATAFAGLASAASNHVKLYAESDNQDVNNKGLYSIHEGAAINYVFLGSDAQELDYDYKTDVISLTFNSSDGTPFNQYLGSLAAGGYGSSFPTLEVSVGAGYVKWSIEDGYLKGNGSENFFVAKNTGNDPYRYSENSYQVALYPEGSSPDGFSDVAAIKVKAIVTGA